MQNNPITEVALLIVAGLLIIAGAVLLYLGSIDFTGATLIFGLALGLLGYNSALKAPSPAQQAQLGAQTETLQQIAAQALAVLPTFASLLHSHTNVAPVAPPQAQQTAQPVQPTVMPVASPVAQNANVAPPVQPFQSPLVSQPAQVVQQPFPAPTSGPGVSQNSVPLAAIQQVPPQRDPFSNSSLMQAVNPPKP